MWTEPMIVTFHDPKQAFPDATCLAHLTVGASLVVDALATHVGAGIQ